MLLRPLEVCRRRRHLNVNDLRQERLEKLICDKQWLQVAIASPRHMNNSMKNNSFGKVFSSFFRITLNNKNCTGLHYYLRGLHS